MELVFTAITANRKFGKALTRTATTFDSLLDPLTKDLDSSTADFDVLQVIAVDQPEDYLKLDDTVEPRQLQFDALGQASPGGTSPRKKDRIYQVNVGMLSGLSLKPADDRAFIDAAAAQLTRALRAVALPEQLREALVTAVEKARAGYAASR